MNDRDFVVRMLYKHSNQYLHW